MVSDVSSVVSDYLFSEQALRHDRRTGRSLMHFVVEYPVAPSVVRRPGRSGRFGRAAGEACLALIRWRGQRADIRADYLGDFPPDNYAAAFVDAGASCVPQVHGGHGRRSI